jgi:hypothetical protein
MNAIDKIAQALSNIYKKSFSGPVLTSNQVQSSPMAPPVGQIFYMDTGFNGMAVFSGDTHYYAVPKYYADDKVTFEFIYYIGEFTNYVEKKVFVDALDRMFQRKGRSEYRSFDKSVCMLLPRYIKNKK